MSHIRLRAAVSALLLAGFLSLAQPEQLKSELGFFVDMPSGFGLKDGDGKTRFAFADPESIMEFDILSYEPGRFSDAKDLSSKSLAKLASTGDSTAYIYEGRDAVLAELGFALDGAAQKGYAVFVKGRADRGQGPERDYALLAYAPEPEFEAYSDFILSCLDAFSVDRAALRSPGPVSQFTLDWPPPRDKQRTVALVAGGSATLPWADSEGEQESQTVAREYKVLGAYADEPVLYKDAWSRFYRMAYRESAARLDRLALESSRLLAGGNPTETARKVLAWVQGFSYDRGADGTDFIPPLRGAYTARGDCDSRAMVAAIVLERMGIGAILMVSREYSHALLGVDVPGGGQRFAYGGKQYLVGETTAKVGLGMMPADMADWSKWMGIGLAN